MAPRPVDSTLIIFDIGEKKHSKNGQKFFEQAKECIIRIVERKIISRPTDLVGIILLGSENTKNNLAAQCPGSFENIEMLYQIMKPDWAMLRNLPTKASNKVGDWFEAILVAADYYKNGLFGVAVTQFKIVLMTDFETLANIGTNVEKVLQGFQEDKFELTVIGYNIYNNSKSQDVQLAKDLVEITQGSCATFEDAMNYLLFHRNKTTKPVLWNVDLSIGPNIKIPVTVYGRIRDNQIINTWQKAVKDPVTEKSSTEVGVTTKKEMINAENNMAVDVDDTITGYVYGQKAIPFSENDKALLYKSGDRCLSIYGFTNTNNVKWENLSGNGVSYLFGRKEVKKAQNAVNCLIECMLDMHLVGIARRVYNKGNAPMMHVLAPILDGANFCLSVIAINYKEDIKHMAFPSTNLPKYSCSKDQVDAFKDLINAMNLMSAYDESYDDMEAFPTAQTVNPSVQYVLDCITFRAMNPGKPLPGPRDDLMVLFNMPSSIEKKSREAMDNVKKQFNLKKVEMKTKNNNFGSVNNNVTTASTQAKVEPTQSDIPKVLIPKLKMEVYDIGTVNPVEDYKILENKGKNHSELVKEIIDVMESLLLFSDLENNDNAKKILDALAFFKEECVKNDPSLYNNWLKSFRKGLFETNRDYILSFLNNNKVNVITKKENTSSVYSDKDSQDDSQLYENNTVQDTDLFIESDIKEFFDEM